MSPKKAGCEEVQLFCQPTGDDNDNNRSWFLCFTTMTKCVDGV
jgi:hypothetical protein